MAVTRSHVRVEEANRDVLNTALRVVAMAAAIAMTLVGLIAVAKVDWSGQGFDAPAVTVADMAFGPWVAIATVVAGVLALAAAVSWDRTSKLFMGALLAALGIAIIVANPDLEGVVLSDRMGVMALVVGGILVAVGVLIGGTWGAREIEEEHVSSEL